MFTAEDKIFYEQEFFTILIFSFIVTMCKSIYTSAYS